VACLASAKFPVNHLVGRGDGQVDVLDIGHTLVGCLHILRDGSQPSPQTYAFQYTYPGQFQVRLEIVSLVTRGGKAEFTLEDTHLVEIDVDKRFFQFGKPELGRLHAIPIGYIDQIYFRHWNHLLRRQCVLYSHIITW
jgi:hypothetical protein